ncbi:hypothetical protein BJ508DRAFT_328405 [Ascobolus immersus RN42]|uniref:Uncharacterized protein n=1 Tax=Ascobolus immersus RN42 TaxID=1160509 RepID=A0A3N4I5G2_ASCIM|nr:hypothetical protein BJ508DRAFT_328405 [Ascobolus immersus RN42]
MASATSQLYVPMNMNELGAGHMQHQHQHHQAMMQSNGQMPLSDQQIRQAQWDQHVAAFTRPPTFNNMQEMDLNSIDYQAMSKMFAPDPSVMQLYEVTPASVPTAPMTRAVPLLDYQPPCPSVSESTPASSIYSPPSQYMSPQPLYPSEHISTTSLDRRPSYATSYTASSPGIQSPGIHSQHTTPPPMPLPYEDCISTFDFDTTWQPSMGYPGAPWDPTAGQTVATPELTFTDESSPAPEILPLSTFALDFSGVPEDKRPEFLDLSEYELVRLPCIPGVPSGAQHQQEQQSGSYSFGTGMEGWGYDGVTGLGLGYPMAPTNGLYFENSYMDQKLQQETERILATCETFESLQAAGKKRKQQLLESTGGGGKATKLNDSRRSSSAESEPASKPSPPPAPRPRRRTAAAKRPTKAATVQVS